MELILMWGKPQWFHKTEYRMKHIVSEWKEKGREWMEGKTSEGDDEKVYLVMYSQSILINYGLRINYPI